MGRIGETLDQYQWLVTITAGALTLIAFGDKIWKALVKFFTWLLATPHEDLQHKMDSKCVEFEEAIINVHRLRKEALEEAYQEANRLEQTIQAVSDRQEQKIIEMNAMCIGVRALLHDSVFRACNNYIERGYISSEELENLECLYDGYKGVKGNGTCETLYNKVQDLDIKNS